MRFLCITLFTFAASFSIAANKPYQAIDTNGNVLFIIEAEHVSAFSDGLARIQQVNLVNNAWVRGYGFINTRGDVVIPCVYKKAQDFVDDRAWVQAEGDAHWTLLNKKGEVIPTKKYEKVGLILEGYSDRLAVYENGAMGWIDRDGKELIPCRYVGSSTFDPEFGLACVTLASGTSEKYGFINKEGTLVIPHQYQQAGSSSFTNGFCRVSVKGKTVLINAKGEVVFTPTHRSLQNFSHGIMPVATQPNRKGWGYCNLEDKMVIPGIYDHATSINSDGFGIVEKTENKGLIDPTGKFLLPLKYETIYAEPSVDGYICGVHHTSEAMSLSNTPKDYFDAELNPVDVGNATLMSANGTNRIPFTIDRKRGFMNRDFNIVIPAQYKKATPFVDGISLVLM